MSQRPGRVLIVAPQPFYEDRGTPIAVQQMVKALLELGHEVDLLTYPIGRAVELPGLRVLRSGNPLRLRHVPIGFSWRKVVLDLSLVRALARRLARRRYEWVHAVEESAFPAVLLARRRGIPVIYDMQSSIPEQLTKHWLFRLPPARLVARAWERWILRRASAVVCSAGLGEHVQREAPSTPWHEWRYASPLVPAPAEAGRELRATLGISATAPLALYSGTFESYQGLSVLLEAIPLVLAEIPNAVFVLVGAGATDAAALAQRVDHRVPPGALRVIERQPRAEMPRYLAMADVVVSPRVHGGNLPLKIFDYLNAGRPIVATDIPTHRRLLDTDRALLVPPTARALARAVSELMRDHERAARLGLAARAYADEHLGWMAFVESVGRLVEETRHGG